MTIEEAIKQKKFVNEYVKININVLYTANWLNNQISSSLKPFNISHEQFNILRILRGSHPTTMCQKEIKERMIAPNSNVTHIIKKLKTKNYITVEQSIADKREYKINITEQGLKLLNSIDSVLGSAENIAEKLTEEEAIKLNELLDKIRE